MLEFRREEPNKINIILKNFVTFGKARTYKMLYIEGQNTILDKKRGLK